ncbi:MAG TPA: PH domain-containing protein [Caulobacteraceae bacterium]|jgi:uncharacterized membrane protein YdbT with pleckstrin-like domain
MSYLERSLQPGETILAMRRLHWVIYVLPFLHVAVALVLAMWGAVAARGGVSTTLYVVAGIILILGIVTFVQQLLIGVATEFAVTNHRLLVKRGVLSVHTVEMSLDKVESVDVDQTLVGRMLGFGSVTVHGVGSRWDPINLIPDPAGFRNAISAAPASRV